MRDTARLPMARRRRVSYHLRAEPGGRHYLMLYGLVCRFTVGHDLVGTSVAVGERVSPQRPPFEGAVRASRIASSGPPTKIWAWYATVYAPRAFWLVACLQPPPRAQGVTGPPYKGPGSIPPKRCPMITHLFTGLVPRIMRTITSQRGLWWEPRAVRMGRGGSSNLMR